MSVFKIEKNKNFTIMSNYHLKDINLSLKAKGLLSYMLSLPEDWDYSLKGLCAICKENKDSIRSALKELENNYYLKIAKSQNKKGCFEYDYIIYETPDCNPDRENPYMDKPDMDNPTQINTKRKNIKKQIDKGDKTISSFFVAEEHNRLTLELIYRNYINENDSQIFYYDKLFEELLSYNSYKELIIITHYIISRVTSNKFYDEDGNYIENKYGYFKNAMLSNINKLNCNMNNLYEDNDFFTAFD